MSQSEFPRPQIVVILAIAIVGGVIAVLQPILLASLLADGRISATQVGLAATLEGLGMALSATLAGIFWQGDRLRSKITAAVIVALVANLLTLVLPAEGILAARLLHGGSCGILLWLVVGMFSRLESPARIFAIYTTAQSCVGYVLATSFSSYLVPKFGALGGYSLIAVIDVLILLAIRLVPASYSSLPSAGKFLKPTLGGLWGLLGAGTFIAGIMAFWVYLIPLGESLGHPAADLASIISFAIALQIAGGFCASVFAPRLNATVVNIASGALCLALVWSVTQPLSLTQLYAVVGGFSFLWMFTPAFHMPMIIRLDSTRRSAMFISTAQLGGLSLGPLVSAQVVSADSFTGAIFVSIGFFATSVVVATAALLKRDAQQTGVR